MRTLAKTVLTVILAVWAAQAQSALGQPARSRSSIRDEVQRIAERPEFLHATFGIEFYSLDADRPIFQLNSQKLFPPASTIKLVTEGTALVLLGPDYRFHTRVYRTGKISANGVLSGDLILVASGDPDLSQRIQPDGTLAFQNDDHSYGGKAVPGDPLSVIRELAAQVRHAGVKRISGRVLVDASMFPEGEAEQATGAVLSPVIVNDNLVDVTATPGRRLGAPVSLQVSPVSSYVRFISDVTTGPPGSKPDVYWISDQTNADGAHLVIAAGNMPIGGPPALFPYAVPQPSLFAEAVFAEALRQTGVAVSQVNFAAPSPDFTQFRRLYNPQNLIAEHVSPPLAEDVKITLKTSQNLHADIMPYVLGSVFAGAGPSAGQAGLNLERVFLRHAGLDLSSISQSDGEGADPASFITPDFMVRYLAFMKSQKVFPQFLAGFPVLGRDGTLWETGKGSAAAGNIFAKTGTYFYHDDLNHDRIITSKSLAGYMTTVGGRHLAFAIYLEGVRAAPGNPAAIHQLADALAEIAEAAYQSH